MRGEEAWQAWQRRMRRRRCSPATIRLRGLALHDLWGYLEERGKTWEQVEPEDVDGWLDRACHPGRRNAGLPLQDGSRATYGRAVLCFYRWAAETGLLKSNPLADAAPPPRPPRRPRALPVSAVTELLVELAGDQRLRMMVLLGYHQALRVSEIVALRVTDLALYADPPLLLVRGKGGRQVWMPCSPALVPGLRAYLLTRPPSGPLLPNYRYPGQPLDAAYAARLLARAMRPVVGDSGHALRHTAAQQLRRLTRDPFVVRDALRHSSLDTLDVYVGGDMELLADALSQLPPIQESR